MSPADFEKLDKATLEHELQETKDRIASVKSMGADVEAAEIITSQAERALEKGNLEMAKALIESTIRTFSLIKQQYFIQAASILFSSLQRSIVSLEGAGSEVSYIKDLYNRAKEKFDAGQYEEAMDFIKSAEDMVNDIKAGLPEERKKQVAESEAEVEKVDEVGEKEQLTFDYDRSQEQMELVSKVLIRVEQLLQEAVSAGYAVNEAEKLYSLAEDAFDYQDYKKAEEYALQSERSLEEVLRPMREEMQKTKEAEVVPIQNKPLREDLPSGNSFLDKTKGYSEIMPKGIIGDAPKGDEAPDKSMDEEAMDAELAVEKEATNLLITADEKITTAKDSGINIPMAERLLSIGESYFDRGDFEKVREYADKAIKQVNDAMARKGIPESKATAEEEVKEEVEEEYEEEFEEDEEAIPAEEADSRKLEKTEAIEKLESQLMEIKAEVDEAREMGLAIDDAEELITKALDEFNSNSYTSAKQFGATAQKELKSIKKVFIKKKALEMVKYAWKEIEKAENLGADTTIANELLQDSRDLVKEGKYQKAAELAMKSIQMVKEELETNP
ncbi:hypothetical protein [[Eubacterium] cellulosolvens]